MVPCSGGGALPGPISALRSTAPAVLTDNLFMDSHPDCAFLLSPEGQQALVDLHVDGIIRYLQDLSS